jgi:hypothetical protein
LRVARQQRHIDRRQMQRARRQFAELRSFGGGVNRGRVPSTTGKVRSAADDLRPRCRIAGC